MQWLVSYSSIVSTFRPGLSKRRRAFRDTCAGPSEPPAQCHPGSPDPQGTPSTRAHARCSQHSVCSPEDRERQYERHRYSCSSVEQRTVDVISGNSVFGKKSPHTLNDTSLYDVSKDQRSLVRLWVHNHSLLCGFSFITVFSVCSTPSNSTTPRLKVSPVNILSL